MSCYLTYGLLAFNPPIVRRAALSLASRRRTLLRPSLRRLLTLPAPPPPPPPTSVGVEWLRTPLTVFAAFATGWFAFGAVSDVVLLLFTAFATAKAGISADSFLEVRARRAALLICSPRPH